jgi:hypothetical protein
VGLRKDDTALAVGVGLLLLGGGKALAAAAGGPRKRLGSPEEDGANLLKRANQARAQAWVQDFLAGGADPATAAALARWAGIESSGNPLETSRLGERGLMQAGPHTVEEGGLTAQEWAALVNPKTTRAAQAGLAVKYVDWLWQHASTHVADPPADPIDQIWYAKLWHQWPVDVRDFAMHGPAAAMARQLAAMWAGDEKRMHRLRAANVVAWGTPTP